MRNMSFALTTQQVRAKTKTVTRRMGWTNLKVGEQIMACEKCMGRKKGEPLVRLCVLEVVSVRREKLGALSDDPAYGIGEIRREGFGDNPELCWPSDWVPWFCASHKGCTPDTEVTRIEFKYAP